MGCPTVASQNAMPRINQPATCQAMMQLLELITEATKERQEEEELDEADLVDLGDEIVEESPEQSQ